jgi:hypothetical protein
MRQGGLSWRGGLALLVLVLGQPGAARADISVALYGDIGYAFAYQDGFSNAFAVPRVEPFTTANFGRLSVLVEPLLEVNHEPFNPAYNSFTIDVERLQLSYDFGDSLRLTAGRFHSPIGYYNDTYHHGVYFMMTEERPGFVDFEDSGGLIPAHMVGVKVDGRLPLGRYLAVRYDAAVGNSRNPEADNINLISDSLGPKAFCARLRLEPGGALDGLLVGGNFYGGNIAAYPGGAAFPMTELTYGAHLAYLEHGFQFIAEGLVINHREQSGPGRLFQDWAYFAELGYSLGDFTPYGRFERVLYLGPEVDPFFAGQLSGLEGSHETTTVGLRYLANEHLALKLELLDTHHDVGDPSLYAARFQASFAF